MTTTLYGLQNFVMPSLNCRFEKVEKDKDISHNLIHQQVIFDLTTNKPLDKSITDKLNFRKMLYDDLNDESVQRYYIFQRKCHILEEKRRRFERRQEALKLRIKNFDPFIEENNYRHRRTCEFTRDDLHITKLRSDELALIKEEIEVLSHRKAFFSQANKKLKRYENFLTDTLSLLPTDYVKGLKENNMTALLRRCDALFHMNKALYGDLTKSSLLMRALKTELDACYEDMGAIQTDQSLIFPQLQNKGIELQKELSFQTTEYSDTFATLRKKMHIFGIILISVNNLVNKGFQMIKKAYHGEIDITMTTKVMMMDPELKFAKIEEYISSAILILELLKEKKSERSD